MADFRNVCDSLLSQGMCFDAESLKLLDYDYLMMACSGSAGTAIAADVVVKDEMRRRFHLLDGVPASVLETEVSGFYLHDVLAFRADEEHLVLDWNSAPPHVRAYHVLKSFCLRPVSEIFRENVIDPVSIGSLEHELFLLSGVCLDEMSKFPSWRAAALENLCNYSSGLVGANIFYGGRRMHDLPLVQGHDGSYNELFSLFSIDDKQRAVTKLKNHPKVVEYRRYFLDCQ